MRHTASHLEYPVLLDYFLQRSILTMSSDDYFDGSEQLNSAFLAELDAIEVAHVNATQHPSQANLTQPALASSKPSKASLQTSSVASLKAPGAFMSVPIASSSKDAIPSKPQPVPTDVDADESYDQFFDDIDPIELDKLDNNVEKAFNGPNITNSTSGSGVTRQLTLFGDLLPSALSRVPRTSQQKSQAKIPHSPRKSFGKKARKVKRWDHTAFAKSGGKLSKGKAKSKGKAMDFDGEADEAMHSTEEFEQFPSPSMFLQPQFPAMNADYAFRHRASIRVSLSCSKKHIVCCIVSHLLSRPVG
jgi:ATP-dependent DNA helicase MPH1